MAKRGAEVLIGLHHPLIFPVNLTTVVIWQIFRILSWSMWIPTRMALCRISRYTKLIM